MKRHLAGLLSFVLVGTIAGCGGGGGGGGGGYSSSGSTAALRTPSNATTTTTTGATTSTKKFGLLPVAGSSTLPLTTTMPTTPGAAHLSVDTDRDGQITLADEPGRNQWSSARGAVFAWNNDDDGQSHPTSMAYQDCLAALDCATNVVHGTSDTRSDGAILAWQLQPPAPTAVVLSVTPATAPARIFMSDAQGNWSELVAPGAGSASVPVASLMAGDVNFLIEGTGPRSASWDGTVTVTLDVQGSQPSQDTVVLREAPVIYTDNTRPAQIVYCMKIDDPNGAPNTALWNALTSGLQAQSVQLYAVDQNTYGFDRWVQDNMQTAYQGFAGPSGYDWINEFNQLERGNGAGGATNAGGDLWSLLPNELLGPNGGMAYAGPSQVQDSPNYGGNFEVLPPYGDPNYPFGRFLHGGGDQGTLDGGATSRHMNPEEVALVEAQGMQTPGIEISSEWLAVGHLDEFLMAVPDLSGTGAHSFKLLWSSPALALQALKTLQANGQGNATVFTGEQEQTTVNAILADTNLMTLNDEAQTRLDADRAALEQLTGLTDSDFVQVPVFYEVAAYGGLNFVCAEDPGVQNCIPINDTLYVPDPYGPKDPTSGQDVWQQQVVNATSPLGLKVVFVDVYTSYHQLMGEAHCGSNIIYKPYDAPWWTK
jgi:protein-arginine deiminase